MKADSKTLAQRVSLVIEAQENLAKAKWDVVMEQQALIERIVEDGLYHCLSVKMGPLRAHIRHASKATPAHPDQYDDAEFGGDYS